MTGNKKPAGFYQAGRNIAASRLVGSRQQPSCILEDARQNQRGAHGVAVAYRTPPCKRISRLLLDISAAETKRGTALLKEAAVNQLRYVSETTTLTDPE